MSEQNNISMNIKDSKINDTQMAMTAGGSITQIKQNNPEIDASDVITELDKLIDLIHQYKFSDLDKNIALRDLNKARNEATKEKPRKNFISKYLKNSLEVLITANKNIDEGNKFIHTAKSILKRIIPWLNVTLNFFRF